MKSRVSIARIEPAMGSIGEKSTYINCNIEYMDISIEIRNPSRIIMLYFAASRYRLKNVRSLHIITQNSIKTPKNRNSHPSAF